MLLEEKIGQHLEGSLIVYTTFRHSEKEAALD